MIAFLSGTFEDLKREREALLLVLSKLKHGVSAQENLGAGPHTPIKKIYNEFSAQCFDYYILIVGSRYGTLVPKQEVPKELKYKNNRPVSYCEVEFDLAGQKMLPRFVYLKDQCQQEGCDVNKTEASRRDKFIKKIGDSGCTYYTFQHVLDLATQTSVDIQKWMHEREIKEIINGPDYPS